MHGKKLGLCKSTGQRNGARVSHRVVARGAKGNRGETEVQAPSLFLHGLQDTREAVVEQKLTDTTESVDPDMTDVLVGEYGRHQGGGGAARRAKSSEVVKGV
jgi:hypothetical protein